jgi:hypothetical protein
MTITKKTTFDELKTDYPQIRAVVDEIIKTHSKPDQELDLNLLKLIRMTYQEAERGHVIGKKY